MRGWNPWIIGMLVVFLGTVIFLSLGLYGYLAKQAAPVAVKECQHLCYYAKAQDINLAPGPCLSDLFESQWNVPDWVCDVAHSPRQPVDNLPQNQCTAYREGKAHHFVEVDENCNVIRVV